MRGKIHVTEVLAIKNLILSILGFIFLGLGAVGIVFPIMPATPFVLLSAVCFSAGNNKISCWLQRNRIFGPFIENYHTGQGVSKSLKIGSILFTWVWLIISMAVVRTMWIYVILGVVGVCVTIHLILIKTKKER